MRPEDVFKNHRHEQSTTEPMIPLLGVIVNFPGTEASGHQVKLTMIHRGNIFILRLTWLRDFTSF